MAIIEHGAEQPFLHSRVPVRPCVAADIVRAAGAADDRDGLAGFRHAASLPLANRRSNRGQGGTGPKW